MRPERFPIISVIDDAIDTTAMTVDTMIKYHETRDISLLPIKAGARATIYHVRAVPHSLWQSYVMAGGDHNEIRYRRAFICGIEKVENLLGSDSVGVNWAPTNRISETTTIMTEEECNDRFSPYEVLEIGSVIFKHSFLPRRMQLTYLLPSSCVEVLAQRRFRSADASPSDAPTTISLPRSSATDRQREATAST